MKASHTLLAAALILAAACSPKGESPRYRLAVTQLPGTVAGMKVNRVEASSFTFNAAFTGRPVEGAGRTVQVCQRAFWVTAEPVGADLVASVTGKKGPYSYDDMEKFLDRFYKRTRVPFIIPSESMLEAAMLQGAVGSPAGVVVSDDWNETAFPAELEVDWRHTEKGNSVKVVRTRTERKGTERFRRSPNNRFHLAVLSLEPFPEGLLKEFTPSEPSVPSPAAGGDRRTFEVNGASFTMVPVEGGPATLGGTKEQLKYAEGDETPVVETSFRDFLIGETEVTAGLWQAVMGSLPAWNDRHDLAKPVVGVSWYDAKEFIVRLNDLTGERFRLPGEYEWEYAARGGRKSRGYVLSGGNPPAEVGVYSSEKKTARLAPVRSMKPNELGLYDMSGNAWEWVQGTYPDGSCVLRGGSCASRSAACRVSNRQAMRPGQIKDTFGFRLAL